MDCHVKCFLSFLQLISHTYSTQSSAPFPFSCAFLSPVSWSLGHLFALAGTRHRHTPPVFQCHWLLSVVIAIGQTLDGQVSHPFATLSDYIWNCNLVSSIFHSDSGHSAWCIGQRIKIFHFYSYAYLNRNSNCIINQPQLGQLHPWFYFGNRQTWEEISS